MWQEFKTSSGRRLLASLWLAGLVLRLWVAWQPVETLVRKNLPDDAYYYFVLAHNAVQHGSVSLDGVSVTNGFHPLWWLLLLPLFAGRVPLGDVPVHLALSLASALDMLAAWALAQVAARLTRREELGALALVLYAANPLVVLQATNGLETGLAMACLAWFWWVSLRWLERPGSRNLALATGALGGLTFLARSDSVFFIGLVLLAWWWRRGWRAGWPRVGLAGGVAMLLAAPWLLWSRLIVGTWLQESGVAVTYAMRVCLALGRGPGLWPVIQESWRHLTDRLFWLTGFGTGLPLILGVGAWTLVLVGLAVRWRCGPRPWAAAAVLPLLGASVLLFLIHVGVRWYPRPWYFVPSAAAFAVCAALALAAASRHALFVAALASVAYFSLAGSIFWRLGWSPWQSDMLAASHWLARNTPREAVLASFNAGLYAYYSGRRVVNLDGAVNHAAFQALQGRAVIAYLWHSRVSYVIDYDSVIRRDYAPFMGAGYPTALDEVAVLGGADDDPQGRLRVYRVLGGP
jgi:hypothetical protein